ncbi:kinase-like protein [Ascodesmis nigricans]|uniref:dual-specificity kinase n=1 Tax=Ascodesmis nigricans TaxID=341454 RepID=A0A4S2MQ65_9PEZI|nr:kinase-like protein [Ascodesmis nigricans]
MSTPSTATQLVPIDIANPYAYSNNNFSHHHLLDGRHRPSVHHHHPPHHHQPYYHPPPSPLTTNTPMSSSFATRQPSALDSSAVSNGSTTTRRRKRAPPDWDKFYQNGIPKEVIEIEDTPPPQHAPSLTTNRPHAAVVRHADGDYRNGAAAVDSDVYHAGKRRKLKETYEPHEYQASYSSTQTPHLNGHYSSPATVSAQSSNSSIIGTTSVSALGVRAAPAVAATNGVKRKRVTRLSQAQALAATNDAFASYHPPPQPPIKAKEVYVKPVRDVSGSSRRICDDQDGHFIVTPKTTLGRDYEIVRQLGQGTFGKVVEAIDRRKGTKCAIKVIRSVQKYRDASRIELRVLATLAANDKGNRNKCIHLRDCFDFKNHICIVTDLLGMSVFDFLKGNSFAPFPNSQIQHFARQLLTSVAFLHDLNLIHTDLKPENILLVNSSYQNFEYNKVIPSSSQTTSRRVQTRRVLVDTEIRLIDFGSATFDDEYHSSVVSTRHYRAPEIILGLGWSFPCDIWSIGCILVEFFTGDALFQTHDNLEHLAMMQAVCGAKFTTALVKQIAQRNNNASTSNAAKYFKQARLNYPNAETSRTSKRYVNAMKKIEDIIPATTMFNKQFIDLLKKIFVYDPHKRITAKDALKHPWFRETSSDDGTRAVEEARRELAFEQEGY